MMPQVDGYQFLKQCAEDPVSNPQVFNRQRHDYRPHSRLSGVDALPKPFDPDELVAIVENLLERRAAQDQTRGEDGETPDIADLANQIAQIKALLTQRNAPNSCLIKIDLTPREQSVLNLVTEGLMNKETSLTN